MARTFLYEIERRNGPDEAVTEILVEYAVTSWGCDAQVSGPAEGCCPAEPVEIEIISAMTDFGPFVLRDSEIELIEQDAAEKAREPDYDDWDA